MTDKVTKTATISLARRHVLGDLYDRCDELRGAIPVYLAGDEEEVLGYADESLGHYADALSFHLADDNCKKLSAGHFLYSLNYDYSGAAVAGTRRRIKLISITLTGRKSYEKPHKASQVDSEVPVAAADAQ
jgi:hypothetical protein